MSLVAKEGGYTQQLITAMLNLVPGFGNLPTERTIPALAAIYTFITFAATSSLARGAQEATAKKSDNNCTCLTFPLISFPLFSSETSRINPAGSANNIPPLPHQKPT